MFSNPPNLAQAIRLESDLSCATLEASPGGGLLRQGFLPREAQQRLLTDLLHYLRPGPLLMRSTARRIAPKDQTLSAYLEKHARADRRLLGCLVQALRDLGPGFSPPLSAGPPPCILALNARVSRLHSDPDPALILVSDLSAKAILDRYGPWILSALRGQEETSRAGSRFWEEAARLQTSLDEQRYELLSRLVSARNQERFLNEVRHTLGLFGNWLATLFLEVQGHTQGSEEPDGSEAPL